MPALIVVHALSAHSPVPIRSSSGLASIGASQPPPHGPSHGTSYAASAGLAVWLSPHAAARHSAIATRTRPILHHGARVAVERRLERAHDFLLGRAERLGEVAAAGAGVAAAAEGHAHLADVDLVAARPHRHAHAAALGRGEQHT